MNHPLSHSQIIKVPVSIVLLLLNIPKVQHVRNVFVYRVHTYHYSLLYRQFDDDDDDMRATYFTHNTYDTRDDRTNEWKRYEFYLFLNFSCYIYHITAYHRINHTQTAYLCCSNNNFHSFDAFFYFFLSSCCNSILTITQNSTPNLSIKLSFVWFIFIPDVKMTI